MNLNDIIVQARPKVKAKPKKQIKKIEKDTTESESYNNIEINDNELINPCKDEILFTKITLRPDQMNNDLYINLKKNLIDKVEGKCISYGYIIKVYKILDYSNGIIEPENFTGSAIYDIKYLAKICVALKNSIIIAKITSYNQNLNFAVASFGNIKKIIFNKHERDLNINIFSINNDKSIVHLPTQKILKINDFIKVQIKSFKLLQNDVNINCLGYLYDIPTQEEINLYAYSDDFNINKEENNFSSINFNDENEIEEKNIAES